MRIPFDSLTLAAVIAELQPFVGAKVQRIIQPDEHTVVLGCYGQGGEAYLLISWDPVFFRMHLVTKRPANAQTPPQFCMGLRSKLDQARLRSVRQVGFDRIAVFHFEGEEETYWLIVELMGKHSNLALVDSNDKILAVAKAIGPSKSKRPVLVGRTYSPPPLERQPSLLEASSADNLANFEGVSPFLQKLIATNPEEKLREIQDLVKCFTQERGFEPVYSPGNGAYPMSVAPLGLVEIRRQTISIALEQYYSEAEKSYYLDQSKTSLLTQLERVLIAREAALSDLGQAKDNAARAGSWQLQGELVLAYGSSLPEGSSLLDTADYEGKPLTIKLDPTKTYLENAERMFARAKKAKSGSSLIEDQIKRLRKEKDQVEILHRRAEDASTAEQVQDLREEARERRWVFAERVAIHKEDRPYEGHRVRELIGPGGVTVLFGENATSNDYLTLRVAKPDDYWLHVRGGVSAHVVIRTQRHPEKVGPELLRFAARIAVLNSPSKHAGLVPVDYTLRKYVRKPKGASAGTALYTHEKTLHVEK